MLGDTILVSNQIFQSLNVDAIHGMIFKSIAIVSFINIQQSTIINIIEPYDTP